MKGWFIMVNAINRLLFLERKYASCEPELRHAMIEACLDLKEATDEEINDLIRSLDVLMKTRERRNLMAESDYEMYHHIRAAIEPCKRPAAAAQ